MLNRQLDERRPSISCQGILIRGRRTRLGDVVVQRRDVRVVVRGGKAANALVHRAIGVVDREVESTGADILQAGGLGLAFLSHAEAGDPEDGGRKGCRDEGWVGWWNGTVGQAHAESGGEERECEGALSQRLHDGWR